MSAGNRFHIHAANDITTCKQRILKLAELPPCNQPANCQDILSYLIDQMQNQMVQEPIVIFFPSLMVLTEFFETTQLIVYDALKALRQQGYHCLIGTIDDPICVWKS